ncbi:uncharacterized protein LOC105197499 isoform X2 [Solenopsis invicta]|uniref:uncharacterized protein LOC105197499 isoform X2 n=1 Tax=Solenopsis invicta TaxID=13686 RepID=UPI00193E1F84|nr:uncharacterized protein LOC105197499 isoform X2 [Solenopsis invicta]
MEKTSFASCQNYFDRLRRKTREIDEGIERLTETWRTTWRTPHLLVGGYAERTAETNACLEEMWEIIRSTGDAVEKFNSELESSLDETDRFLQESQAMYEDLKEQCNNLDIVLAEFGYHYEEDSSEQENHSQNNSQTSISDSVFITEELPDVEVEFTPNLTWKCKAKSRDSDNCNGNSVNPVIKGIATPVIKSLKSVLQSEILNARGSYKQ